MKKKWRPLCDLTPDDLQLFPVWEFINNESVAPETAVRPIKSLPVCDLTNRVVGTRVVFNNGGRAWAILSNISLCDPCRTKHFLCIRIENGLRWYDLARYHDVDIAVRGPNALAKFLGLTLEDIFPVKYDISTVARGDPKVVSGIIKLDPDEKLSEDDLFNMALQ